jgi:hypothetical protein
MHDVKVTLRGDQGTVDYTITAHNNPLAHDWLNALEDILQSGIALSKNFCFLGFPNTPRTLEYLCRMMNQNIHQINIYDWSQHGLSSYVIEEWFTPDVVRFGEEYPMPKEFDGVSLYLSPKHDVLNRIHNHFERLQGTVEVPSMYYLHGSPHIKKSIGQLNTLCHEIESLILSQRKHKMLPQWTRPSQITTFARAPRHTLRSDHKKLFLENGYDRVFGGVYMHWAQIGKTLFEVFRDENSPDLDATTCEAINHLKYYSGEFDIEWGHDLVQGQYYWHDDQLKEFHAWLNKNNFDPADENLCLGYAPIGQVEILKSFGTTDPAAVWEILQQHMDIHAIELRGIRRTYEYTWRDQDV